MGSGFSDFFQNFFGSGGFGERTHSGGGRKTSQEFKYKEPDLEASAEISLEEAFTGTERIIELNSRKLRVRIKPGVRDGETLRIKHQGTKDTSKGDVLIKVQVPSLNGKLGTKRGRSLC